ncbi:DUF3617 domain-containing protein [Sandaracinobacteroides saxicola]|uniref:DUF3617 domain-containing protein n=1 Tax=Sandaracinobacteroides saxicola TaxID=2759707 RepID=A0A7G5IFK4_9SPHN|nr:DUF3617 domain-containing protein [Sandaracinobacteroides saxicola]QMW22146.1 DUF3617 domain-containing protein [Sandaracinobacteroides saxicola]
MTPSLFRLFVGLALLGGTTALLSAAPDLRPGEWEVTMQNQFQKMPEGMPPEVAKMMASQAGKGRTMRYCITAEELRRDPAAWAGKDANCTVSNYRMSAGTMTMDRVCRHDGETTATSMRGSYTPTSYAMSGAINHRGSKRGSGDMAMTLKMQGRWVAATCSAKAR